MAQPHEFRPSRRRAARKSRWPLAVGVIVGLALVGATLFFPAALLTDRSTFCRTCHEMLPYYDGWVAGQHSQTAQCIDCHVDAGLPARFAHKFVALGEVKSHFTGDMTFPRATPPDVPNKRCTHCHTTLPKTTVVGFNHQNHADKGTCQTCHAKTGHNVTAAVLQALGIYNASAATTAAPGGFATIDGGQANIKNHKKVSCSRCHDMAKTGCPRCHKPLDAAKHTWKGDCTQCHTADNKFAFAHPSSTDCAKCHKLGDKHFKPVSGGLAACKSCHSEAGKSWKFSHPGPSSDCTGCHKPPVKHFAGQCPQCHADPGGSWKFAHPASSADCAGCHTPPAKHYAGQCSQCHHGAGGSWKFSHPSSGEHSWKSQPCAKCHPTSFPAVSCTCHGGRPPSD